MTIRHILSVLFFSTFILGCKVPPSPSEIDTTELIRLLQSTTAEWNNGNLDGFIAPYDSSSTFMTRTGPIGREEMRARYRKNYFTDGQAHQILRFEQVGVRTLGEDYALMTGRYVLTGGQALEQNGWFTLVWQRTASGWKIVHDQSG